MSVFSKVFPTQTCTVKRNIEGHTDPNTGQWLPAGEQLIATIEADIQPKSGRERASELQTEYESDSRAFIDNQDITFEPGYSEIKKGDILIDASGKNYTIVYPGKWDEHYICDLKEND